MVQCELHNSQNTGIPTSSYSVDTSTVHKLCATNPEGYTPTLQSPTETPKSTSFGVTLLEGSKFSEPVLDTTDPPRTIYSSTHAQKYPIQGPTYRKYGRNTVSCWLEC
jgi:hypothetical protein